MSFVLELKSISKSFTEPDGKLRRVISGISLNLSEGDAALIEGPSGAGKSTLLNVASGLLLPDSGEVQILGRPITGLSESERDRIRASHIGYIFQSFNLISPLSVLENLTIPLRLAGKTEPTLEKHAAELLERFGLEDHAGKKPFRLSVGQRQRVAAARAILLKPALLLADEPTASLDAASAQIVTEAIKELKAGGSAILLATHDPALKQMNFSMRIDMSGKEAQA